MLCVPSYPDTDPLEVVDWKGANPRLTASLDLVATHRQGNQRFEGCSTRKSFQASSDEIFGMLEAD